MRFRQQKILVLLAFICPNVLFAQQGVGIGTTNPDESAVLHVDSPDGTKGMLIPRMTRTDRDNIQTEVTPAEGLIIYNTTDSCFDYYDGASWVRLIPTPAKFNLNMNANKIINLANGTAAGDAVNKGQLDAVDNANLDRNGNEPMTGDLDMGNNRVSNITDGINSNDAITKSQLDSNIEDLEIDLKNRKRVFTNNVSQRSDYPTIASLAYFFTETNAEYTIQSTEISNSNSTNNTYLCVAFFHMGGSGEGEDIGVSLAKENNIFASWRRLIRPSSQNGEDQYMIMGLLSLAPGETATIYNRLKLFDDDIFITPRGMFVLNVN